MTSMPASRSARAITFAPRSWPSSPGLATNTRIFFSPVMLVKDDISLPAKPHLLRSSYQNGARGEALVDLSGKVAVVTGASRGAGRGIALALGEAGATVYVVGRTVRGGPAPTDDAPGTVDDAAEEV